MEKMPFQSNKKIKVSRSDNVSYHHDTNVIKRFSSSHNNKYLLISSTNMMPVKLNDALPTGNVSDSSNKLKEDGNNCSKNRLDLDRVNITMIEKTQVKLSHPSSTCVPITLLSESIATVSKAAMLSKLTSLARSISLYHSSSSSQP